MLNSALGVGFCRLPLEPGLNKRFNFYTRSCIYNNTLCTYVMEMANITMTIQLIQWEHFFKNKIDFIKLFVFTLRSLFYSNSLSL